MFSRYNNFVFAHLIRSIKGVLKSRSDNLNAHFNYVHKVEQISLIVFYALLLCNMLQIIVDLASFQNSDICKFKEPLTPRVLCGHATISYDLEIKFVLNGNNIFTLQWSS